MMLVHIFFWVCVLLVATATYYWVRLLRGSPKLDPKDKPLPWWTWATFAGVGILGVIASAPGLFFDQPHWFMGSPTHWIVGLCVWASGPSPACYG